MNQNSNGSTTTNATAKSCVEPGTVNTAVQQRNLVGNSLQNPADLIRSLLTWAEQMGGWEAPCWTDAERFIAGMDARKLPEVQAERPYDPLLLTQLPDDVVSAGYRKINDFKFAQIFRSVKLGFEGTEQDFVKAGLAYQYKQLDAHTRVVVGQGRKLVSMANDVADPASMTPPWPNVHDEAAFLEGWIITDCSGSENGPWQVQRIDDPDECLTADGKPVPHLTSDVEAMKIVATGTRPHHIAAREFLKAHNPIEFDAVMQQGKLMEQEQNQPEYYVWCDDSCDNKTSDPTEALRWVAEFRADGREDVYVVNVDNVLISEAELRALSREEAELTAYKAGKLSATTLQEALARLAKTASLQEVEEIRAEVDAGFMADIPTVNFSDADWQTWTENLRNKVEALKGLDHGEVAAKATFVVTYANRNGSPQQTQVEAGTEYEVRKAVAARRDCDSVMKVQKLPTNFDLAKDRLICALTEDKVAQWVSNGTADLTEVACDGFKGFRKMPLGDLLQCAYDADLPKRYDGVAAILTELEQGTTRQVSPTPGM